MIRSHLQQEVRNSNPLPSAGKIYGHLAFALRNDQLQIHTPPALAMRILRIVEESTNLNQIARLIEMDVALSAYLIRAANSALLRGGSPFADVQRSVTRLGLKYVRSLVVSFSLSQLYRSKSSRIRKTLERQWQKTMHVATLSHLLSNRIPYLASDQAMMAGLLHAVGVPAIVTTAEQWISSSEDIQALEEAIQRLYQQAGERLLEQWNLYPHLREVVTNHLQFARDPGSIPDYTDVVMVANLCAAHEGGFEIGAPAWTDIPACSKFGFPAETLKQWIGEQSSRIREIQSALTPA